MWTANDIKGELKAQAGRLGFDSMRVARAERVEESVAEIFRGWLRRGMADEMGYLSRNVEKRLDPGLLLEGARSALVFAAGFFRPSGERRVALFAQSEDYHAVLKRRLFRAAEPLERLGFRQKVCVDTAPLMEKYLAIKSGVGWLGKSSLVITRENGPWQFLGVILTTAEIEPDPPVKNRCGTCRRCVDACPTGALSALPPHVVDARICISNLTIERKGPLSKAEMEMAGGRIFGCDECLRACPYGRFAKTPKIGEFRSTLSLPENASPEECARLIASERAQNLTRRPK